MIPARRKIDRPRGFRQAQGKQTGPEIGLAKLEIGPGVTDRPRDRPRGYRQAQGKQRGP